MRTINETTKAPISTAWGVFEKTNSFSTQWNVSPRKNGVLVLRANPMTRQRLQHDVRIFTKLGFDHTPRGAMGPSAVFPNLNALVAKNQTIALAKFRGKIYKGSASLGVTAASWRQSATMIHRRYRQLALRADVWSDILRYPANGRAAIKKREGQLAGFHLEVLFGWTPLLGDIHAAANTMITSDPDKLVVTSNHQSYDTARFTRYEGNGVTANYSGEVTIKSRLATMVSVSNGNTWLRERAGLNNPATIAWDLVPWSFVVNMFVNTGQLVQSLTDFAGLSFDNASTTTMTRGSFTCSRTTTATGVQSSDQHFSSNKVRTVGLPLPSLVVRIPDLNLSTVAMAASLFTQKFSLLSKLVPSDRRGL